MKNFIFFLKNVLFGKTSHQMDTLISFAKAFFPFRLHDFSNRLHVFLPCPRRINH